MGAGVVELEPPAAGRLDGDRHVLALAEAALRHPQAVDYEPGPAELRVEDVAAALAAGDLAGVADLAAGFRVERRAVEDHLHLVASHGFPAPPAPRHHREDPRGRGQRLVAEEL